MEKSNDKNEKRDFSQIKDLAYAKLIGTFSSDGNLSEQERAVYSEAAADIFRKNYSSKLEINDKYLKNWVSKAGRERLFEIYSQAYGAEIQEMTFSELASEYKFKGENQLNLLGELGDKKIKDISTKVRDATLKANLSTASDKDKEEAKKVEIKYQFALQIYERFKERTEQDLIRQVEDSGLEGILAKKDKGNSELGMAA